MAIAWICDWSCRIAIVSLLLLIVSEVFCRTFLGFSLEITDEIGGYILVAVCFLSLPTSWRAGGFHRVGVLRDRLPPRGQDLLRLVLESLSLAFCLLVAWYFAWFVLRSWRFGDASPTELGTPLWIPRLPMLIGVAGLAAVIGGSVVGQIVALARACASIRRRP